ncbi:hypothetical protein H0H93_011365 [Arthromyces matolae]|nr:hypothetical protein H0H93_011365 [Arthromyces matolae]
MVTNVRKAASLEEPETPSLYAQLQMMDPVALQRLVDSINAAATESGSSTDTAAKRKPASSPSESAPQSPSKKARKVQVTDASEIRVRNPSLKAKEAAECSDASPTRGRGRKVAAQAVKEPQAKGAKKQLFAKDLSDDEIPDSDAPSPRGSAPTTGVARAWSPSVDEVAYPASNPDFKLIDDEAGVDEDGAASPDEGESLDGFIVSDSEPLTYEDGDLAPEDENEEGGSDDYEGDNEADQDADDEDQDISPAEYEAMVDANIIVPDLHDPLLADSYGSVPPLAARYTLAPYGIDRRVETTDILHADLTKLREIMTPSDFE